MTTGDIYSLAGIPELTIGQTVIDPAHPNALPTIAVEEPTIKEYDWSKHFTICWKKGKFFTSRQIKNDSWKKETNLGLRIEEDQEGVNLSLHGRGELQQYNAIETMRQKDMNSGFGKPYVIFKTIDGVVCEPFEEVTVDVDTEIRWIRQWRIW